MTLLLAVELQVKGFRASRDLLFFACAKKSKQKKAHPSPRAGAMEPRRCVSGPGFFDSTSCADRKRRGVLPRPRVAGLIRAGHRCGWGPWKIKIKNNSNGNGNVPGFSACAGMMITSDSNRLCNQAAIGLRFAKAPDACVKTVGIRLHPWQA